MSDRTVVIGGGAAGFFYAINYAENNPGNEVIILEKSKALLGKVKISGGSRCNVTNVISNPYELKNYYPRGGKELIGPFTRFTTADTVRWFEQRGVKLKTEQDGRIFPVSDDSQTIINCFLEAADRLDIKIVTNEKVTDITRTKERWDVSVSEGQKFSAGKIMIASGDNAAIWDILEKLGHTVVEPVPSLFTFISEDTRIKDMQGISFENVRITLKELNLSSEGPLLITHNGLSGPAVLKLSSWGARDLHNKNYKFIISINFLPSLSREDIKQKLLNQKSSSPAKTVSSTAMYNIPKRYWHRLCTDAGVNDTKLWGGVSGKDIDNLTTQLYEAEFGILGRNRFKEEFVTCGGIDLKEVNFKNMESKILPGIHFAGEVLNIDALTGGFNFQAAWTTAYIAAVSPQF